MCLCVCGMSRGVGYGPVPSCSASRPLLPPNHSLLPRLNHSLLPRQARGDVLPYQDSPRSPASPTGPPHPDPPPPPLHPTRPAPCPRSLIGCMGHSPLYPDPTHRWHDPTQLRYFEGTSPLRVTGPIYVLSARAIKDVIVGALPECLCTRAHVCMVWCVHPGATAGRASCAQDAGSAGGCTAARDASPARSCTNAHTHAHTRARARTSPLPKLRSALCPTRCELQPPATPYPAQPPTSPRPPPGWVPCRSGTLTSCVCCLVKVRLGKCLLVACRWLPHGMCRRRAHVRAGHACACACASQPRLACNRSD